MSKYRPFVVLVALAALAAGPARSPAFVLQDGASQFDDAEYYVKTPNENKAKPIGGVLVFDTGAKTVRFLHKGKAEIEIPYGSVTSLLYERTAKPRYTAAILISPLFLFSKSKKHFLTIQYKSADGRGEYALIRLDKKNYQPALAMVEAQTSIKVERTEER